MNALHCILVLSLVQHRHLLSSSYDHVLLVLESGLSLLGESGHPLFLIGGGE